MVDVNGMMKRLLALLLATLFGFACLAAGTAEEDWRSLLRDAFGLSDDAPEEDWAAEEAPGESADAPGESADAYADEYVFDDPITDPQQIVNYLYLYGELPENFITKKEAKALGWDSSRNYVGEVAPGKSIGGDRFGNYEGLLPGGKSRTWYECDANYRGKGRGAERVLFSSDGLYYYTDDHYKTFTEMYPEGFQ